MSRVIAEQMDQQTKIQKQPNNDAATHKMCMQMEEHREIKKYSKWLEKLMEGTIDMPGFLKGISPQLVKNLIMTSVRTDSDNLKSKIYQDLLDRAGYGKIHKGAVLHQSVVDAQTTKTELVNLVLSMGKKAGVKIKDSKHVEADSDVIDV